MTPSNALIICDDLASSEHAHRALAEMGLVCRSLTSQQLLEQSSFPPVTLACICRADAVTTQKLLTHIQIELAEALTPIVVLDETGEPSGAAVQIVPSAQTTAGGFRQTVERLLPLAEQERQSGVRCDVRFRLLSDCKLIDGLTEQLHQLYQRFAVDTESDHRLTTAVREMSHNAIEWGNRGVADALVWLRCTIDSNSITIHIRDSGPGFNREALPHAASSQDPTRHLHVRDELGLRAGGFGILMTRGLVDELSYNEAGNEVKIVKRV